MSKRTEAEAVQHIADQADNIAVAARAHGYDPDTLAELLTGVAQDPESHDLEHLAMHIARSGRNDPRTEGLKNMLARIVG